MRRRRAAPGPGEEGRQARAEAPGTPPFYLVIQNDLGRCPTARSLSLQFSANIGASAAVNSGQRKSAPKGAGSRTEAAWSVSNVSALEEMTEPPERPIAGMGELKQLARETQSVRRKRFMESHCFV